MAANKPDMENSKMLEHLFPLLTVSGVSTRDSSCQKISSFSRFDGVSFPVFQACLGSLLSIPRKLTRNFSNEPSLQCRKFIK